MRTEDWMTVQQKAGEKVAPIDFPGNFRAAIHPRWHSERQPAGPLPTVYCYDRPACAGWAHDC